MGTSRDNDSIGAPASAVGVASVVVGVATVIFAHRHVAQEAGEGGCISRGQGGTPCHVELDRVAPVNLISLAIPTNR